MIATVLGPLDAGNITGNCCSREELLHKASPAVMKALHDNPITLANLAEIRGSGDSGRLAASNRLFSLDESVQELASLKDAGGLVLECSAVGDGRDPSGLAEISRRSGVAVVMAASAKEKEVGVGVCYDTMFLPWPFWLPCWTSAIALLLGVRAIHVN